MKTTIDLPEEVLHRAKVVAAQKRTTLKALVLSGLRIVLSSSSQESLDGALADILANGHNTDLSAG